MLQINYLYSSNDDSSPTQFNKFSTGSSLLSDDIFDQVDELFEGSDEDKLNAYKILVNLNEEVSDPFIFYLLLVSIINNQLFVIYSPICFN